MLPKKAQRRARTGREAVKFTDTWNIRDATTQEETELAALKFTVMTGIADIETEQVLRSLLLRDNFPYLG